MRFRESRRIRGFGIFGVCLLSFFFLSSSAPLSAAPLKTLSGRVHQVDSEKQLLIVDFTHPATGAVQAVSFRVTQETGLQGFSALPDMKPKDIVTVDYEEKPDGISKALYVAKFRISGPPEGLESFKGL